MATIVTRSGKGSPLTNNEVDANFNNLNTEVGAALPKAGGAMTGAITTNSTFDGRDVATDGTKLDGVEASADVTDTANVTSAGALMDSELTSIASVKALNQGVSTGNSPTFANFTSNGLDDNATSTAITIDSSQNVTLGVPNSVNLSGATLELTLGDTGNTANDGYGIGFVHNTADLNAYILGQKQEMTVGTVGNTPLKIVTNNTARLTIAGTGAATFASSVTATSLDISGNIDVDGVTNLDVVDIDGAVDMASTLAVAGVVTANAGVVVDTMTLDGSTLTSTGDFIVDATADIIFDADANDVLFKDGGTEYFRITNNGTSFVRLDSVGDIILDADGGDIYLDDGGTGFGQISGASSNLTIKSSTANKDIIFQGNDGGSAITALTLDMSEAGAATFAATINSGAITSTGILTLDTSPASNGVGDLKVIPSANSSAGVGHAGQIFGVNISSTLSSNSPKQYNTWGGVTGATAIALQADDSPYGQFQVWTAPQDSSANTVLTPRFWINGAGTATFSSSVSTPTLASPDGTGILTLANTGEAQFNRGIVVNEGSFDSDFRVESNNLTHALFVDGSNGYIGINDSAPSAPLDLNTSSGLMTILNSSHTNGGYVRFEKSGTVYGDLGNGAQIVSGGATTAFGMNTRGTGDLLLATNGVTRASIKNGGAFATNPLAGGHAVFNESGVNVDFQVLSNGNNHMLFVDGGTNRIGIGKSSPSHVLDVANPDASVSTVTAAFRAGSDNNDNRSNVFIGQQNNSRGLLLRAGRETGDRAISQFILNGSGGTIGSNIINALEFYENGSGVYTTTFNQDGENVNFRVESDNLASALFINGADGKVTMQGATTVIGSAASSTNVEFNLNGVASKATRIQFQEGGANKWLLGQGAASETTAFELFNAAGQITLSVNRGTNVATFIAPVISPSFVSTAGGTFTTASGNDLNIVYPASRSLFIKHNSTTNLTINNAGHITSQYGSTSGYAQTSGSGGLAFVNDTGSIGSALVSVTNAARGWSNHYVNRIWSSGQDTRYMQFTVNGSGVSGSINVASASTITFNTSSDYRLKENVVYDWDATTRLKQLKPARFNFIADGTDVTQDGFMAHEAQEVVPIAVTGTKDAMKDEDYEITPAVLDDDGVEITAAVMGTRRAIDAQGIDHSKLVPLLVKTIQELESRITILESGE